MKTFIHTTAAALFLFAANTASAGTIYLVTVNTASISGVTGGGIDFALDPGLTSALTASAVVSNFSKSGGSFPGGGQTLSGGATGGPIAGASVNLVTAGGAASNDDFELFNFGSSLSFLVNITSPASSAGTGFLFSLFDNLGNPLLTNNTDNTGALAEILVNANGALSGVNQASNGVSVTITATPEPATIWLAGAAGLMAGLRGAVRRRSSTER